MKTSVIEVRDMLSVLSVDGVEERIGKVPGVESVTLNYATGSATVRFDETRLDIADIKSAVRQDGYESESEPGPASKGDGHEGHSASDAPAAKVAPAGSKTSPAKPATAGVAPAGADAPPPMPATPKPAPDAVAAPATSAPAGA